MLTPDTRMRARNAACVADAPLQVCSVGTVSLPRGDILENSEDQGHITIPPFRKYGTAGWPRFVSAASRAGWRVPRCAHPIWADPVW